MQFFEETFFGVAQKKDGLHFFFIRNTSHRYIMRDLNPKIKETPVIAAQEIIIMASNAD
jgi:hypothetical protein